MFVQLILTSCNTIFALFVHLPFVTLERDSTSDMSHVVSYRVLSHVLRLHSHRVLEVLPEKR